MQIQYFIMDVDGTLTDGKIYMSPSGEAMKAFNIKDGCGIHDILIPNGIVPVIITGRVSEIVTRRCEELDIKDVYQGVKDKVAQLEKITDDFSEVAYIGDDIIDLPCMKLIRSAGGLVGCPSDAVESVKNVSHFVAHSQGGNGAVREFIEWVISLHR